MKCTTAVEGEWLAELGPMFFSLKRSYADRLAKRKREKFEEMHMQLQFEDARRLETLTSNQDDRHKAKSEDSSSTGPRRPTPNSGSRICQPGKRSPRSRTPILGFM